MRYYIVGYMYSGKSTFGRVLAEHKGLAFVDMDDLFEQRYHYTIGRFMNLFGEEAFRKLEHEVLLSTFDMDNCVVATGGGTPCFFDNMTLINQHGISIYLQMTIDQLFERAIHSRNPRPLMRGLTDDEVKSRIMRDIEQRVPFYSQANILLDGTNPSPTL